MPRLTRTEAIEIARKAAETAGWTWEEPVHTHNERSFFPVGRPTWLVISNAGSFGGNVFVRIDDKTGEVLSKSFTPRSKAPD